jgi:hypothetical protein
MTSTNALVAELEAQGLRPLVRDGKLKLAGPKARLTPDLVERVRAHKVELIDLFAPDARDVGEDPPQAELQPRVEEAPTPIVGWRDDPQTPVQTMNKYCAGNRSSGSWDGAKSGSGAVHSGLIPPSTPAAWHRCWNLAIRSDSSIAIGSISTSVMDRTSDFGRRYESE